jgi:hypothetical protein
MSENRKYMVKEIKIDGYFLMKNVRKYCENT